MSKKRIAELEDELSQLRAEESAAQSRKFVACGKCGKKSQIGKLTYIQTHWWVRAHGCIEGAYYLQGEGQFICPKCGIRNRLLSKYSDYARKIEKLKFHFKDVKDTYGRDEIDRSFVNL